MKITKTVPALPTETPRAPALTKKQAMIDTAERASTPQPKSQTIDRTALADAVKNAHPITFDANAEQALATLVKTAALGDDDSFSQALAAFAPAQMEGLAVFLQLRQEAIAPELADRARFSDRCAQIAAKISL